MNRGGKRDGAGRPKDKPNAVTKEAREVFNTFLLSNVNKLQSLFGKVAEENPTKAIELILKISEFVLPKLKAVEIEVPQLEQKELVITIVDNHSTP
jgi:hypothetical protein